MNDLELVDSVTTDPATGQLAGCFLVRRKCAVSADAEIVGTFFKRRNQGEDVIVFYGFLDQKTAVVLWSRAVTVVDVVSESRLSSFGLKCGFCSTGVLLLERQAIVAGTGDDVECYDLTDRTSPRYLPLEYIDRDDFKPVSDIDFGYAILSKARLVDIEEREGKLSFVIWSIIDQKVLRIIPFSFPEGFTATYCHTLGKDEVLIGDYDDKHFVVDLNSGEWRVAPPNQDPLEDCAALAMSPEEVSYFWRLVDLGGNLFASLPRENVNGVWVHVWDVDVGIRIANFQVGIGPVNGVRRLSDDTVEVASGGVKEVWNIRSGKRVARDS